MAKILIISIDGKNEELELDRVPCVGEGVPFLGLERAVTTVMFRPGLVHEDFEVRNYDALVTV